jgi:hypothetical protein
LCESEVKPEITTDDIEVAQFLYLLIHNEKLRKVIDTITTKVVLILGRFSEERKVVLDAVRDALRTRGLLPVIFRFLHAHLSRRAARAASLKSAAARISRRVFIATRCGAPQARLVQRGLGEIATSPPLL